MTWLDDERGKVLSLNGTNLPDRKNLAITAPGAIASDSEASGRTTIDLTALTSSALVPLNLSGSHTITDADWGSSSPGAQVLVVYVSDAATVTLPVGAGRVVGTTIEIIKTSTSTYEVIVDPNGAPLQYTTEGALSTGTITTGSTSRNWSGRWMWDGDSWGTTGIPGRLASVSPLTLRVPAYSAVVKSGSGEGSGEGLTLSESTVLGRLSGGGVSAVPMADIVSDVSEASEKITTSLAPEAAVSNIATLDTGSLVKTYSIPAAFNEHVFEIVWKVIIRQGSDKWILNWYSQVQGDGEDACTITADLKELNPASDFVTTPPDLTVALSKSDGDVSLTVTNDSGAIVSVSIAPHVTHAQANISSGAITAVEEVSVGASRADGTYLNTPAIFTDGSGSGAVLDLVILSNALDSYVIQDGGEGYQVGDLIHHFDLEGNPTTVTLRVTETELL